MRVIQKAHQAGERVVALGTFDGVHRGHRTLIREAKMLAAEKGIPLRLCTFNRHPLEVLRPDEPPELLSTIPEKASEMKHLGVDEMELIPFDKNTAEMEPEAFLERLRSLMKVRGIVAGWNYSFGRKGRGTPELLKEDGNKHGYEVLIVPPAKLTDGTVISSSLVRQMLREGNTEKAGELLGRSYSITGTCLPGTERNSQGISTSVIEPWIRKALPKDGIYACLTESRKSFLPGVLHVGTTSNMMPGETILEIYHYGETPQSIGQKIRVMPLKMIREEELPASEEEMHIRMEKDWADAMKLFNMA